MLDSPKGKRGGREGRERERKGGRGEEEERGELARCTKGRGWRCVSCKYRITACQRRRVQPRKRRETQLELKKKKKPVCVSEWIRLPTHARRLLLLTQRQPALVLFRKFPTLNSRSIDFIIEAAAALAVAFNPEAQILASQNGNSSSLHRLRTGRPG